MYNEALVHINAQEFKRDFYTTMQEDLMKLRAIWEACGKPNPEVRANDGKRGKAVTMATSALHWTRKNGKKVTLGSMYKKMQDYIQHAWYDI